MLFQFRNLFLVLSFSSITSTMSRRKPVLLFHLQENFFEIFFSFWESIFKFEKVYESLVKFLVRFSFWKDLLLLFLFYFEKYLINDNIIY